MGYRGPHAHSQPQSDRIAGAALTLRADSLAARGVQALRARSIPCLLLRGPVLAQWLYDNPADRVYVDADLLVPSNCLKQASEALNDLGLNPPLGEAAQSEQAGHAQTFSAGDDGMIDLHWTLSGIGATAEVVWRELASGSTEMRVAGESVNVPGEPARALIVAIHAAQHGPQGTMQLEDIRRAVSSKPRSVWSEGAVLAEKLDALPAFAQGLRRAPGGQPLLDDLGLEAELTTDLAVRAAGNVPTIRGLAQLSQASGLAAKAKLVARELWPTPAFMRAWSRLARRGPFGLAIAYAFRPFWLVWHIGPAYLALRRARGNQR